MRILTILGIIAITVSVPACKQDANFDKSVGTIKSPAKGKMSVPDVEVTWNSDCLDAFNTIVAVFNEETQLFKMVDGKKEYMDMSKMGVSVPWLTIYNGAQNPIAHNMGYNSGSLRYWNKLVTAGKASEAWPRLNDIAPYTDLDIASLPKADFIFAKYSADWCVPCKVQSADLQTFRVSHPELKIVHLEIVADTMEMTKRKKNTCPVKI